MTRATPRGLTALLAPLLASLLVGCGGGGGGGDIPLPKPVVGLRLIDKGKDTINLSWSVSPTDTSTAGFVITRNDGVSRTLDAATRSFDDTGLVTQTQYCYQVSATNARSQTSDVVRRCLASGWRDAVVASIADRSAPLDSSLAVDATGAPNISYVLAAPANAANGDLWLARPSGDAWINQRIASGVARHALVAAGMGGIAVAYIDGTSKLLYAGSVDSWMPTVIDDADVSTRPSLVVDAKGSATIAYISSGVVKAATNRSGMWTMSTLAPGRVGGANWLALDASGRAYVAFSATNGDVQLATASADGLANAWSIETVFPYTGGLCGYSSASIDVAADGGVHFALTETCHSSGNIYHAQRLPTGAWQIDPLMSDYLIFRAGPAPIVDAADGATHIAAGASALLLDIANAPFVNYWTNRSGSFKAYTLTNDGQTLGSLAVDAAGDRHAVYTTAREVRYLTTRP